MMECLFLVRSGGWWVGLRFLLAGRTVVESVDMTLDQVARYWQLRAKSLLLAGWFFFKYWVYCFMGDLLEISWHEVGFSCYFIEPGDDSGKACGLSQRQRVSKRCDDKAQQNAEIGSVG